MVVSAKVGNFGEKNDIRDLGSTADSEISEKHFSTLETRMRISHIQSRTSRRERDFLSPNLMLRDKTENNFFQSQASRRDRDLFFSISDYETRSRIFLSNSQFLRRERESIYCYLSQRNHILSNFFTQKFGEIFYWTQV